MLRILNFPRPGEDAGQLMLMSHAYSPVVWVQKDQIQLELNA